MGFKSGLSKALPWINLGAILAGAMGGKTGAKVAQATGAALTVVNAVAEQVPEGGEGATPAPLDAVRAVAVAVDDHQGEIAELKRQLEELRAMMSKGGGKTGR